MAAHWKILVAAVSLAVLPLAPSAFAHHAMGGALPNTAWQGLLSGLAHPVIGVDHLAFVLGIGAMAHVMGRPMLLPLVFVTGTVLGCAVHIQGYDLPAAELVIALTVAVAAAAVGTRAKLPVALLAALLVVAGAFHGYAYGESIIGAETAPLAAYIAGFGVIQACVAVGSAVGLRATMGREYMSEAKAMRIAGGGLALVAALAFISAALAG